MGRSRELLQSLGPLAGASRELRFLAHRLWRTAPLWRHRFVALRFGSFAACSVAPSHRLPQGSGQGIVAGQISMLEVARHGLKYGMLTATGFGSFATCRDSTLHRLTYWASSWCAGPRTVSPLISSDHRHGELLAKATGPFGQMGAALFCLISSDLSVMPQ